MSEQEHQAPSPLFVVGVGASAGGLEALQNFLKNLPEELDNMCFIIAQHLSPSHPSHLVELLGRQVHLKVLEARDNVKITPQTVYITPPDRELELVGLQLKLTPSEPSPFPKPSVDKFFLSLSKAFHQSAVGIILSGTGRDGSKGVIDIKSEGGLVIVQEPQSAKYDGMPVAALESGAADMVLAPEEMGKYLKDWQENPSFSLIKKAQNEITPLEQIVEMLSRQFGTDFNLYKQNSFLRRLDKRLMMQPQIKDLASYVQYLKDTPGELNALFQDLLIGVTAFFRDPEAFAALQEPLKNLLEKKRPGDLIRIWVPACASGEEAYSLAILVHTLLGENAELYSVQVFATDIDKDALQRARRGVYPQGALTEMPQDLKDRYFRPQGSEHFVIAKFIKNMVLFSRHDLTHNPPFLKLDLISCRNLLIYFGAELQKHVIPIFHYALNPDSILFLGKSESVGHFSHLFSLLDRKNKVFRRLKSSGPVPIRFSTFHPHHFEMRRNASVKIPPQLSMREKIQATLYDEFKSPHVVIDDNYNVQEIHGDIHPYLRLREGNVDMNILKLIHEELLMELRTVINEVLKANSPKNTRERELIIDKVRYWLTLRVKPLLYSEASPMLLIVFETRVPDDNSKAPPPSINLQHLDEDSHVAELKHELKLTKEHLQTYIEELETSNEELQSLNEELQSTNEELQSTNEELETSNEELQSTNEENQIAYQELRQTHLGLESKEKELLKAQSYQHALLSNTLQGFLLVNRRYEILDYNPTARLLLRFVSRKDIEKFTSLLDYLPVDNLVAIKQEMQLCFENGLVHKEVHQIETSKSEKLSVLFNYSPVGQVPPYELLSVSMMDISEQRRLDQELKSQKELLQSVYDLIPTGIGVQHANGFLVEVNQAFCNIFGYQPSELIGQNISLLFPPELRQTMLNFYQDSQSSERSMREKTRMVHKNGSLLDVSLQSSPLLRQDGQYYIVNSVSDISESEKAKHLLEETQKSTKVGGWEYDLISKEHVWTSEVYHIFDQTKDQQVTLENTMSYFHSDDQPRLEKALEQVIEFGVGFDEEFRLLSHEKQSKWVRMTCRPLRANHRTTRLYGTIQDISSKKHDEHTLRDSRHKLLMATEMVQMAYWDYNKASEQLILSAQFKTLFKDKTAETQHFEAFASTYLDPEDQSIWLDFFSGLKSGQTPHPIVVKMRTQEGLRYWKWFVANQEELSHLPLTTGAVLDIHESEIQRQELQRHLSELSRNNQQLMEFTHIVSHNLQGPVGNIKGLLQLMNAEQKSALEFEKYYTHLEQSIANMEGVMHDLQDLLELRHQKELPLKPLNWQLIWEEIQQENRVVFEPILSQIDLHFEQAPNLVSHPAFVRSILSNLLLNALKYSDPGRPLRVKVWTEKNGDTTLLHVQDNGIGIDLKRFNQRIFKLYQRFHPDIPGRGLGLHMCKTQIEMLGGKIWVDSVPGEGSTFHVQFPQGSISR